MAKKALEQRAYSFEIRADDIEGEKIITGRPIVYNSKTDLGLYDEIIESGALDGTDLTDVRFLVNHDISRIPLARSRRNNGNSTMQFSVDPFGLNLDWVKLDVENNSEARALYSAVQRGDITGMSFMFSVDSDEWENLESEHPTRRIKKIGSVVEVSAVTFPAYDATEIYARSKETLDSARSAMEIARQQRATSVAVRKKKEKIYKDDLKLEKLKTIIITETRYNQNHDKKGRFATGDGGSGVIGGGKKITDLSQDELKQIVDSHSPMWDLSNEEVLELARTYGLETANSGNFFINSTGEWDLKSKPPRRQPDHTSMSFDKKSGKYKKSSEYWYTDEGVYRRSDHWGRDVASCSWFIKGRKYRREGVSKGTRETAFIRWEDLHAKGIVGQQPSTGQYFTYGFKFSKGK